MNVRILLIACAAVLLLAFAAHRPAPTTAVLSAATLAPLPRHARTRKTPPSLALVVYVAGDVVRPGLYAVRAGARADDAVRAAGGFGRAADTAAVNLAERVSDGEEVRVPRIGQVLPRSSSRTRTRTRKKARPAALSVDLNTADASTLAQLPGVGAELAQRIVAFREVNGAFASVDELADVAGMTQRRVDELAPYLRVQDGP